MKYTVQNNTERSRNELMTDAGLVGIADYSILDDRVVMSHTQIERSRRGRGLGAILVRGALEDLRSAGRSVVPRCWYVARFIRENPEFSNLVVH